MEQIYRIGIDHGYGNIKTAHHIFQSGVVRKGSITELSGVMVEYEGKFYEIGSTHKEYQMDKVWDEDYYVLTLAALAKELQGRGLCNASVILAAGLPIKWLEEQAGAFRRYLMQKKEVVFKCNGTRYHVKIDFLGFTFYCGRSRKGMPYIMPKTSSKKFRQKIRDIKVWLYANRDQSLKKLMGMLNLKLVGHYRYYGISFNGRMISNYKQQVRELLFKVLNRRSDRKSYTREGFIEMLKYYPLAMPKIYVSLF